MKGRTGVRRTQAFDLLTGGFLAEAPRGMRLLALENIGSFDVESSRGKSHDTLDLYGVHVRVARLWPFFTSEMTSQSSGRLPLTFTEQ